ncbi:unnamed protein product [Closterium sp. Yama58-4]|nr:unnamed protein product [Closterium sp. Yama58-4]
MRSGEGEAEGGIAERVRKGAQAGGGVSAGSVRAEGAGAEGARAEGTRAEGARAEGAWKGNLKGVQRDGARWRLDRVAKGLERLEKEVVRRREAAALLLGKAAREGAEWQGVVESGRSVQGDGVTAGAVIVERVDEMMYSELHALLGWRVKSERVNLFRFQVPFCLAESSDPSAPRVNISLAKSPSNQQSPIPLVTLHSHLHKALPPTLASAAHLIVGRRMPLGMRSEHRILPVNHTLTAVGHVHVSKDGRAALVPSSRLPYFLLNESREAALQRLRQQRRGHVQRGALFALAAAAVAGLMWWRKRRNERREREYEQQRAATAWQGAGAPWGEEFPALLPAATHNQSNRRDQRIEEILEAVEGIREAQREESGEIRGAGEGEEEEEEGLDLEWEHGLPAEQVCVVCAGRVRSAVFIPCGHRVCCLRCARAVKESSSLCPICRRFVRRVYQVFDT